MPVVTDYTALLRFSVLGDTATVNGRPAFYTFAFATEPAPYLSSTYTAEGLATFQPFGDADKALARAAINAWADASGLVIFEVTGVADINFGFYDLTLLGHPTAAGFAYYPGGLQVNGYRVDQNPLASDIFIRNTLAGQNSTFVLLHEIGHALGFKHPADGEITLDPSLDTRSNTVMSTSGGSASALGALDLAAVAYLYGPNSADGSHVSSWSWDAGAFTLTQIGGAAIDQLIGVATRDIILGGGGDDLIGGAAGDDLIGGGDGADTLRGGAGADIIYGEAGADSVNAGVGDDGAILGDDADTASMGAGADFAYGGEGNDTIFGEADSDVLLGENGADSLIGGAAQDYLFGLADNDNLQGDAGVDILIGDIGADSLSGGDDNDYLYGGAGDDAGFGGEGADLFVMEGGNDFVQGNNGDDFVYGGDGDDTIYGDADPLSGETGTDILLGEAGNDNINAGLGVDYVFLGTGSDTLTINAGAPGLAVVVLYEFTPGPTDGDRLLLQGSSWTNIEQVLAAMFDTGNGYSILTIDLDTAIWLIGVTPTQLTAGDVLFG